MALAIGSTWCSAWTGRLGLTVERRVWRSRLTAAEEPGALNLVQYLGSSLPSFATQCRGRQPGERLGHEGLAPRCAGPPSQRPVRPVSPMRMAHRTPLHAQAIRTAIREALRGCAVRPDAHPLTIVAIASDLSFSRSSVQRTLADASTSFTAELRAARAQAAVRAIYAGATVADAAARVGVTPDHLRNVLLQEYGIAPGALRHCLRIARKLNQWRKTPERSGSALYWRRLRDWRSFDVQLHRHLDPIPPTSALRSWADGVLAAAARPDYRRGVHRQIARDRREQERRAAGYRGSRRSPSPRRRRGARVMSPHSARASP